MGNMGREEETWIFGNIGVAVVGILYGGKGCQS
jgi:hypothetical protein